MDADREKHVQAIAESLHKAVTQPAQPAQQGQTQAQKPAGFAGLSANPFFAAFANQLIDIIDQLAREQVTKLLNQQKS